MQKLEEHIIDKTHHILFLYQASPEVRETKLQKLKAWSLAEHLLLILDSIVPDSLQPHGLYSPWNYPGQNIGVGSLSLLQGIFPTQVSCIAGGFFTSSATRDGLAVLEGCYINMYFTFSKWRVLSLYIRSLGNVLVQNIKFILFFLLWCFKNKFLFKKV